MIDLLPVPQDRFMCPCGGGELTIDGFHLPGMIPFARTRCERCRGRYLAHLHTGFCNVGNVIVDEATDAVQTSLLGSWYVDSVVGSLKSRGRESAPVRRVVRRPIGDDVVLLNCLDQTYGHCVRRLYSLDAYRQSGFNGSVLAIVPGFLAWQVPDDVDEIWIVDAALRDCHLNNDTIAAMTDELARGVRRLRYGDMSYSHLVDVSRYMGVKPFAVSGEDSVTPPRLTLNWREDRCWTVRGRAMDQKQAVAQQLWLYTMLLEKIREQMPDLQATISGYGRSGAFPDWVEDLRLSEHDADIERRWAERHAASHLTFGMHGSNMNLPAALSRGSMELVPPEYWPNIAISWQWVNRLPALEALFRYRQIPISSSVSDIVSIAMLQLRRMQGGAGFELIGKLRETETAPMVAFRHQAAFTFPQPVVCHDENGNPI